ncbi:MAG: Ig-like domain-containing protein, partial [Flavipsychrobacter sp.]|nr:Ig-like domain-containing protein [Flavipsychrobacter sp.]
MKKYILVVLLCIWSAVSVFSQTTVSFATGGTPVYTTPWVGAGSTSIVGTHVQLTPPSGSQNGRIYTSTPITLTGCGSFTAEFEFQVIPSSSAWAIADGIAFWILSPLTGFIGGGGIGLPANPNGLVLVLDNYDNDGVPNDPLISLYGYPTGFTGTYVEGTTTNRIGALNNQVFVTDGGWHHVKLTYAGGQVKVYFNHSAIPSISGTYSITSPSLYFGFCASTGGAWSTQSVRNCVITFDNISPINGPNVVCLSTTPTYTDSTAGGTWSSSTPAVGTIASTGVFTPISAGTTTLSYTYASGACVATKVVTVDATTLPAISGPTPLCSSSTGTYTNAITGGTWSSSSSIVATIGSSSGVLTPVKSGNVTITYTGPSGCYITKAVTINTAPPPLSISPAPAQVCDNGSLTLTASGSTAYNLFPPQSWENGVPTTPGVSVDGWSYIGTPPSTWYRELGATAANPAIGSAMSGSYVANFRARSLASGTTGYLMSPPFSMVGVTSATLSLWVYRDATAAYNTTTYNNEYIYVYLSSTTGGTGVVGYIPRRTGAPITGSLSGSSTPATSGWYQYTYTIPGTVTGAGNYIYIYGQSANGNNIYLDSVTLTGTIGPPTWSPNTYLFNDAAFTTAYSGAPLNPVYMHPTGITSPSTITYTATLSNGTCTSTGTSVVTMNPNPAPITGLTTICVGSSVTLSSTTTGGGWTCGSPGVATIGSSSGIITGITPGTTIVTYAFGSCFDTAIVTVVASPGAITGIPTACLGSTTTLSNPTAGGTWSSSNTAVGTVNPTTGIVTGISLGTTTITYGIATCFSTMTVTVNPYPSTITGSLGVCVGSTTALGSSPSGGFWFTSAPGVATVGVVSGVVTGVSAGTALISYRVGGCATITTVNVVTTPGPITGSLTTCVGSTTTLAHATPSGTWTSSTPGVATVGSSTGIVTGVATGTSRITYSVGTGCFTSSVVTVTAAPPAPTGTLGLCVGQTSTLSHSTAGGTWSMSCPTVATVGISTGVVTAGGGGTCTVTYTLPSGCVATAVVTVNGAPGAITGTLSLCQGASATLSSSTPSGTWTSGSGTVASIDLATGTWTALTGGTSTITYTAPTGCITTADVTVNLAPAAITGPSAVCLGQTMTLASATGAGAWSSSDPTVATVSGTGDVFGVAVGTADITYALASGCFVTKTITVNPSPSAITGPLAMCVGACNTYTVSTTSGTWSSSAPTVGAMLSPGYLCGSSAGTTTITYLVGATGCYSTLNVTVNTLPGTIGGTLSTCVGQCNTLTNSAGGGTWSSSNPAVATVNATTGLFCGVAAGTSTITYSLGSGCITTTTVTVNALPGAISGSLSLCQGGTTTISSTPGGGTWLSDNPTVVSIGVGTGIITTGASSGTATVSYTLSTGCRRTAVVTVNPLPTAITGTTSVCAGQCTTLNSTPAGGTWSSVSGVVGTINPTTGVFCGVGAGTTTVSYTLATGCARTTVMLVSGLPTAITPSGAGLQVCEGSTLSLTGSPAGGTWSAACPTIGTIATGSGTYTGISAGTCNVTYTLASGCSLVSSPITVNPLPGAITGVLSVCVGQTTTVSCTPATGTWSISGGTATIGSTTGVITGGSSGTATITYTLPTGCRKTAIVTINALPGLITGAANVCVSGTTTLNCTPAGGTWSISGSIATIGVTTGIVNGITTGTTTVTYTAGAGCFSTRIITVNPLPDPITGTLTTCVGQTTILSSLSTGGTWSISPTAAATIGISSGIVTGVSGGTGAATATVTYTLPTTCRVNQIVTVYALPSSIGGSLQVCQGSTGTLTTTTPG